MKVLGVAEIVNRSRRMTAPRPSRRSFLAFAARLQLLKGALV